MTNDWIDEYREASDANQKYKLLRGEMTRLRRKGTAFEPDAVAETIRNLADSVEGHLIVFPANDFGLPCAFRPEGVDREVQDEIRQEILDRKYKSNVQLNDIREDLLRKHSAIHKVLVCEYRREEIKYHLPGGRHDNTNFLTVREAVGLVDYTTNSNQAEAMSRTYRVRG